MARINMDFNQAFALYFDAWKDYATKDVEALITRNLSSWELEYWNSFYISRGEDDEYWVSVTSSEGEDYKFLLYGDVPEGDIPNVIAELYDGDYDGRFGEIAKGRC